MSRKYPVMLAVGLAVLTLSSGTSRVAADPPPEKLPLLPPPDQKAEPQPLPKAKAPEAAPVTRVPVELRIPIEDLEKQLLKQLILKVDPKAEAKLPFVVKGNEREFALGADAPGDAPKPAEAGKENADANRPQLIPRPPGVRPRLDRMAARPLIAGVVDKLLASVDLMYRIELRSFTLSAAGNTMTCELGGGFHCEGKAGMPGAALPNVRDLGIKISVTKNLEWNASGKLELKEGTTKVWIDPEAPLVGFPRLDVERVVRLNGMLSLLNGIIDRELMKLISVDNLPDLAVLAPSLKGKLPFLSVVELAAYPIRGDEKNVYFAFDVGLVPSNKKSTDAVSISTKPGPAPNAKIRGKIAFDKDGKPEIVLTDK